MALRSNIIASALAFVIGAADWEIVRNLGARREAWDDPTYWRLGFPILVLAAFLMGMIWRERPWQWAIWLVAGQAAWSLLLAASHDGIPNLLPLGLIMFGLLCIPCLLAAYLGRWIAERVSI